MRLLLEWYLGTWPSFPFKVGQAAPLSGPPPDRLTRWWPMQCDVWNTGQAFSSQVSPSLSYNELATLPSAGEWRCSRTGGGWRSGRQERSFPWSLAESARPGRERSKCAFPAASAKVNWEPESQEYYKPICYVRLWVEAHLKFYSTIWQKRSFPPENMPFILKQLYRAGQLPGDVIAVFSV